MLKRNDFMPNTSYDVQYTARRIVAWIIIFSLALSALQYHGHNADAAVKHRLPKKKLNLYVGTSYKFNVKGCTWKTSKKKIATVTKNGKVKARKAGITKITAISKKNGKRAVCNVRVGKYAKTLLITSASVVLLKAEQKSQIKESITPLDVLYKELVYTSSDSGVAIVSNNGVITPVSNGIASISVTTKAVNSKGAKLKKNITVVVTGCNDNNTGNSSSETIDNKIDLSVDLGDYTTIVVPPTSLPTSKPEPSGMPDATDIPDKTHRPNATMTPVPESTAVPTVVPTVVPTQAPTNPLKTIQDYINSFVVNPNSPLVDTLVVANNDGSMKTLYFLNKAYSGSVKIVVDGYSYSNNTNVTSFLDTLETEKGGAVNNAETVKVYRQSTTDRWAITLLKTEPQIIYYLSALQTDTKYNSPYGLIIAKGNTIGHISVTN